MYDVKNLSVWKETAKDNSINDEMLLADITELNLGVRAYNCLKRAGCNTVGDILAMYNADENNLKKIRNLGAKSEAEILSKLRIFTQEYRVSVPVKKKVTVIKPAKKLWDTEITEYRLSTEHWKS